MIQDILTLKIERNIYVNEEKAVSEIQILINKTFLLFSHHELLMSFISCLSNVPTTGTKDPLFQQPMRLWLAHL